MSRALVALAALTLFVALGCEKKDTPATTVAEATPATGAAAPAPVAAPAPAAPAEPVALETLPVEEQYEADAEQEITAANLVTKVDELEKELQAP